MRVRVANASVTLSWATPADADFDRVAASWIVPGKTVRTYAIYEGGSRSLTDRGLVNGVPIAIGSGRTRPATWPESW